MTTSINKTLAMAAIVATVSGCNLTVQIEDNQGNQDQGGTVVSADGNIDCPAVSCVFDYGLNAEVTLTATAAPGYQFAGFNNAETNCSNGATESLETGECVTKVLLPKTVTAIFNEDGAVDPCPDDPEDNCLENPNGDFDGDGVINSEDACPSDNPDSCPAGDLDGDGVVNSEDACPLDAEDTCDEGDSDGDGILNGADVCPVDPLNNCLENPEGDFDGDGTVNADDPCPSDNPDSCPAGDLDDDGVNNDADNCPNNANSDQADLDDDGLGDVCDSDADSDGFNNTDDCNDLDAAINPDAQEIPDGVDNNCDGAVDEGTELVPPTDLQLVGSGSSVFQTWADFEWTPTPFNDGYEIYMEGYVGGGCVTDHSAVIEGQVGSGQVSAFGLCIGSYYNVKIRARRDGQWSEWSPEINVQL